MPKITLPWNLLYGPGFLPKHFDPQSKNIWTMEHDEEGHHCPEPQCGVIQRSCYNKLHAAFCCAVVQMENGSSRFCGIRFGVTSPKGCWLHHFSQSDANRFFQKAKKGLDYELPLTFPHLQPGWKMDVQKLGSIQKAVTLRFGKYMGDLYCLRAVDKSSSTNAGSVQLIEISKVPKKELLLAGVEVKDDEGEEDLNLDTVEFQKPEQIRNLAALEETNDEAFENPQSYLWYNKYYADTAKTARMEHKQARQDKTAAALKTIQKKNQNATAAKDYIQSKKKRKK